MIKKNYKNIILVFLIVLFLFIFNTFIKKNMYIYAESIMSAFLLIILFLSINFFGFQKDKKTMIKTNLLYITLKILIGYFILIYISGIYFGYAKIIFSLKPVSIINNIFNPLIIFILLELFRYIIISKNNKKSTIIFSILIGILELSISVKYLELNTFKEIYKTTAELILPIALNQFAFGYLCYHGGFKPIIIYRIIIILYMYVMPIHPNLNPTMTCMLNIIMPIIIYTKTKEYIEEEKREIEPIVKQKFNYDHVFNGCLFILLWLFVSDFLPVGITAIASNSMYPTFEKGSGVMTIKVKKEDIKEGDIISFVKNGKTVIHRVNSINFEDGKTQYITKGDANTSVDDGYIEYKDINNKIILYIPLIGYPSIIFEEIFMK